MFLRRSGGVGGFIKMFRANQSDIVARQVQEMADGANLGYEFWAIQEVGPDLVISPITLKAGPRTRAPARELVEVEAAGVTVASREVAV